MSRAKKLDYRRRVKIKETIIGLALAIFIGGMGSAGSYAYFSDRVNADNGIKITMGTLDTSIGAGFNINADGTSHDEGYFNDEELEFNIKNEGTLDEILTLKFENISFNGDTAHEDLKKVEYELKVLDENNKVVYNSGESNLSDLEGKEIKLGRLNSGKSLSCFAELDDEGITPNYEKDTKIKFDLVVDGIQINDKSVQNGGAN